MKNDGSLSPVDLTIMKYQNSFDEKNENEHILDYIPKVFGDIELCNPLLQTITGSCAY